MCISDSVGKGAANKLSDVKTVQLLLNVNASKMALPQPLTVDGMAGSKTTTAIETFQMQIMGVSSPDGRVDPASITLKVLAKGLTAEFGAVKLHGIMINAESRRVTIFTDILSSKMATRAINTPLRQAHFLAQLGHESGELRYLEEIASGDAYEGRTDLGNTQSGDGRRFKGRGLIQLTGRANYKAYGDAIGIDLCSEDNCHRISTDPELAVDVACWFWQTRDLNTLADRDDVEGITRRINGGRNGLADRKRQLTRGKFFLAA